MTLSQPQSENLKLPIEKLYPMKVSEEQSGNHIEPEEEINKKSKRDIRPEAANQAELKI